MIETTTSAESRLVLQRVFPATRERLFDAWTNPAVMQTFFKACEGSLGSKIDVDLRVGGNYRIAMQKADDEGPVAVGTYQEIDRPNRLVCTWRWLEDDAALEYDTLLTIQFAEVAGGTELTLTHERFQTAAQRDSHQQGWSAIIEACATPSRSVTAAQLGYTKRPISTGLLCAVSPSIASKQKGSPRR